MLCSNGVTANDSSHVDFSISVSDHLPISHSFVIDNVLFKKMKREGSGNSNVTGRNLILLYIKQGLMPHLIKLRYLSNRCNNPQNWSSLRKNFWSTFISKITHTMCCAERCAVPVRKVRLGSEIPGWSINLALQESCKSSKFWHQIWNDCDRPKSGTVNDIRLYTKRRFAKTQSWSQSWGY